MCHVSRQYSDNISSISRHLCAKNNDNMLLLVCAIFDSCNQARCIVLDECRHHLTSPFPPVVLLELLWFAPIQ